MAILSCVLMWVLSSEFKKALKFGISLDDTKFKCTHTYTHIWKDHICIYIYDQRHNMIWGHKDIVREP